jgi:hypothetical protein
MDTRIARKVAGYKKQDEKFSIYSLKHTITTADVKSMMDECKMTCTHCLCPMLTEYDARHPKQWTVDRIDNTMGHNKGNVVLCCLECNLKRRNTPMAKFRFTKQLRIFKTDEKKEPV